jgi:hypothetical protein
MYVDYHRSNYIFPDLRQAPQLLLQEYRPERRVMVVPDIRRLECKLVRPPNFI